jgi:hypothetical protein
MIIALVGTPSSGKDTVMEYLISRHDFRRLELSSSAEPALEALDVSEREADVSRCFPSCICSFIPNNLFSAQYSQRPTLSSTTSRAIGAATT